MRATVTRLNWRGHGVVEHAGRALPLPGTDVGEVVEYRVVEDHRERPFGQLVEVVERSPHRVDPGCDQARRCPGCPLRHLSAARQRTIKVDAHLRTLRRLSAQHRPPEADEIIGGAPAPTHREFPEPDWIVSGVPRDGYRAHAGARPIGDVLGLWPYAGYAEPVDLARCPAQTEAARRVLAQVKAPRDVELVLVQAHGDGARVGIHAGSARLVRGDRTLVVHGLEATWPAWAPQSPRSVPALRGAVVEWLAPRATDHIVEVGCGIGTLSIPLARRARWLTGIDEVRAATLDATRNAEGLRATFRVGRARKSLRRLLAGGVRADLVLLHAMRRPLGAVVLSAVAALEPRRVLYLAPSAASLARDLRTTSMRVTRLGFLDQLPGTAHLLTLCQLEP